jgi:hypothetical protein
MSYRDDAQSLQLAFSLHRSGKFAEAAKLYRKVIKKNPREANALHSLALIEAAAGNRAEAAQLMARSLAVQPKNIQFIQNYVTVLCQIGKFETASTECRRGLMCRLLATGRASIGIFAAEGGQFIGGHGMSDDARLRTAAGLSAVWDGESIRRVRAGDGVTVLPGRRLAMHLMAQPDVAANWMCDSLLIDQGITSRVLVTAPDRERHAYVARSVARERGGAAGLCCAAVGHPGVAHADRAWHNERVGPAHAIAVR